MQSCVPVLRPIAAPQCCVPVRSCAVFLLWHLHLCGVVPCSSSNVDYTVALLSLTVWSFSCTVGPSRCAQVSARIDLNKSRLKAVQDTKNPVDKELRMRMFGDSLIETGTAISEAQRVIQDVLQVRYRR